LPFKYGAIVVHLPWLLALLLIGAGATFLARRAGAGLSTRLLVALSPALLIGGSVNLLMMLVVTAASMGGHRVYLIDFVGHFIVGWLVVPAIALLFGSLPFLRDGASGRRT
jgi:TM2 domain-containing membrane protein YozV